VGTSSERAEEEVVVVVVVVKVVVEEEEASPRRVVGLSFRRTTTDRNQIWTRSLGRFLQRDADALVIPRGWQAGQVEAEQGGEGVNVRLRRRFRLQQQVG
jgi:hypothetical protein